MYKARIWYIGLRRSQSTGKKIIRYFYSATYKGKPCFVKLGKNCATFKEVLVYKHMTECGLTLMPALLHSDENYAKNTVLLVTEFVNDMTNFKLPNDRVAFEAICTQLEYIHQQLREADIVHGDLTTSNLSITADQRIVVMDFGIAFSPAFEAFQSNTPFIGTHFNVSGNKCIYDNAYSFLRILDDCNISDNFKQEECYKRLRRLVGVHTHVVNIPNEIIKE